MFEILSPCLPMNVFGIYTTLSTGNFTAATHHESPGEIANSIDPKKITNFKIYSNTNHPKIHAV